MRYRIASFFAGIGGLDLGFKCLGDPVYANDNNRFCHFTYEANFPIKMDTRSIYDVKYADIPEFDILLASFPKQTFADLGCPKSFLTDRKTILGEIYRVIGTKLPRVVVLENLANIIKYDDGKTLEIIKSDLMELGYSITNREMSAQRYGNVPQNRQRVYTVAFRDLPDFYKFKWPWPIKLTKTRQDILDYGVKVPDRFYYTPQKHGEMYKKLDKAIIDDQLYMWRRNYVRRTATELIPTLTATMGSGGHNTPIIRSRYGIRRLTPRECFDIQGFPSDFILPDNVTVTQLYKQAGNASCIPVVERLAQAVKECFESKCQLEKDYNIYRSYPSKKKLHLAN